MPSDAAGPTRAPEPEPVIHGPRASEASPETPAPDDQDAILGLAPSPNEGPASNERAIGAPERPELVAQEPSLRVAEPLRMENPLHRFGLGRGGPDVTDGGQAVPASGGSAARSRGGDATKSSTTANARVEERDRDAKTSPDALEGLSASAFFEGFPNPMLLIDADHRVLACNHEASILLGRPAEHVYGHRLDQVVAVSTEANIEPIRVAFEQGRPVKDVPGIARYQGGRIHVVISTMRIQTADGPAVLVALKNASREQGIIHAIREVARRAAQTADGLATMGEGTSTKVDDIRAAMGGIAQGTQVQAAKVEETVDVIKELARSIDAINNNANEAAQRSISVADDAREGTQDVGRALERLDRIKKGVASSGSLVRELSDHIVEVETIIDFIRDISQKTNMLALNAAIEAARAGEHGKAFGVVADEVKRLSEHTRESIGSVSRIIQEVKEDTLEVVREIDSRTGDVRESAEVVANALRRFEKVASDIMESSRFVESISRQTTEQKRGASAIVSAIDEVAAVAEEASSKTEHTSALANDMAESVEALTAAAQELTSIATSLHATLDRYFQQGSPAPGTWDAAEGDEDDDLAQLVDTNHVHDPDGRSEADRPR